MDEPAKKKPRHDEEGNGKDRQPNDADTLYRLGESLMKGHGDVKQNQKKALQYFQQAADQGHTEALFTLGFDHLFGCGLASSARNFKQGTEYCQAAAEKGHADAQFMVAYSYFEGGDGIEADHKKAAHYYKLAADQGHESSQVCLAVCYHKGDGVEEDVNKAIHYYKLAANQGSADAQHFLGKIYVLGSEGRVQIDAKKGAEYHQQAASQGHAQAQYHLALCYRFGQGVDKDLKESFKYIELAAAQGLAAAQRHLGDCYANGEGVDQDLKKAFENYRLASDQGDNADVTAMIRLSICFLEGAGVKEDWTHSLYWLLTVVNNQDPRFQKEQDEAQTLAQQIERIRSTPTVIVQKPKGEFCPVCHETFGDALRPMLTRCNHLCCVKCIRKMLSPESPCSSECPLCRTTIGDLGQLRCVELTNTSPLP